MNLKEDGNLICYRELRKSARGRLRWTIIINNIIKSVDTLSDRILDDYSCALKNFFVITNEDFLFLFIYIPALYFYDKRTFDNKIMFLISSSSVLARQPWVGLWI